MAITTTLYHDQSPLLSTLPSFWNARSSPDFKLATCQGLFSRGRITDPMGPLSYGLQVLSLAIAMRSVLFVQVRAIEGRRNVMILC